MENPVFQMLRERINIPSQNRLAPVPKGKLLLCFFKNILFILFLERGESREKERESNINVWLVS